MPISEIEVEFSAYAYGGSAVGRLPDGRAVFVPFGIPGERAVVEIVEDKEHFARGRLLRLLDASPDRVVPRCKHHGVCGGCHYQHLAYEAQLRAKSAIVRDQLVRIGHLEEPPVNETVSAKSWNYRNNVQFQVAEDGRLGFVGQHVGSTTGAVLSIEECHLPDPVINAFWPQIMLEPGTDISRVSIRVGTGEELMLMLESESASMPEVEIEAPVSIVHMFQGDAVVQAGKAFVAAEVKDRLFRASPASFFQVNLSVADKMIDHLLAVVPPSADVIVDAYAGVGLFSAFLASRCARLIAIESASSACEDFEANLEEFDNVELYEDSAERALSSLNVRPAMVVLDPPRAGLGIPVVDALVKMDAPLLVYVSCDPATLARDARRLTNAGYRLNEVTPYDMFPQTYHIETLSVFARP